MTTEDIIIQIFYEVDEQMLGIAKHPQAKLYPSELVTIGILYARQRRQFQCLLPLAQAGLRQAVWWLARPDAVAESDGGA